MTRRRGAAPQETGSRRVFLLPARDDLIDGGLLFVLGMLALLGFHGTYSGWLFLVAGGAGLALGIVIAHFANVLRQPVIAVAAMTLAVFFLLGGAIALRSTAIAGVLPSGRTFHGLADQSVHGWKDLLTTLPPVDGGGPLLVLPYLIGLLGGVGGFCLARRTRPGFAPVFAPLAMLVAVILLGSQSSVAGAEQVAAFAVLALAWAAMRQQRLRPPVRSGSGRLTRVATICALLAVAALGAVIVGPHVPGAGSHQRVVLRSYVAPPFDVGQYPSPLAGFRKYTEPMKTLYDKQMFTVRGLPEGTLMRIATLDAYDGLTWRASNRASSPVTGAEADFQRVGSTIDNPARGKKITFTVKLAAGYSGVWLPDVGALTGLRFTGRDAEQHAKYFRYNLATGTGVVPDGLAVGDGYTARAVLDTGNLAAGDTVATAQSLPDVDGEFLRAQATQWSGTSTNATQRILDLAAHLRDVGKYSDGKPDAQYLPGHYEGRLLTFANSAQIVGNDEQYAAAFALMINDLGTPARVIFGAVVPGDGVVKGKDVHAWVEVQLTDGTWRAVRQDRFMNREMKPKKEPPEQQQHAAGKVVPPPNHVRPRSTLDEANDAASRSGKNAGKAASDGDGFRLPAWIVATGKWGGPPVLLLVAAASLIVGLKMLRRRRRRTRGSPASRLAGGWREIVDHARDLGSVLPGGRTRREQGALLHEHGLGDLARLADAHVFGPADPADADASAYWQEIESARRRMSGQVGRWRRLRAAVSLASLRPARMPEPGGVA